MALEKRLDNILNSRSKIAIIRLFSSRTAGYKATGREIAQRTHFLAPAAHAALKELQAHGVLKLDVIGKQHIYSLDHGNRIVLGMLKPMFIKETSLRDEVKNFLVDHLKATRISSKVERSAVADYLKKAADNYAQMLVALEASNSNAAATLAIQCALSLADAVCVFEKGIRSISADHFDACDLVASLPIKDAEEKSRLLKKIIAKKNLVQYERRTIYKDEAHEMVKITARFYQWAQGLIAA